MDGLSIFELKLLWASLSVALYGGRFKEESDENLAYNLLGILRRKLEYLNIPENEWDPFVENYFDAH